MSKKEEIDEAVRYAFRLKKSKDLKGYLKQFIDFKEVDRNKLAGSLGIIGLGLILPDLLGGK